MENISAYTARFLVQYGVINKKDIEIYKYGIEVFFLFTMDLLSIFILSLFIGNFIETICYFLAFMPLRFFSGGYHATTRLRCYIISLVAYIIFSIIIAIDFQKITRILMVFITLFSLLVVVLFAPVVHKNHYLTMQEIIICKRISRKIAFSETLVLCIGEIIFPQSIIVFSFFLGFLAEALSIAASKIFNHNLYLEGSNN